MFANDPRDLGLIPGCAIQNTQNVKLDNVLLSTKHYKLRVKDRIKQYREWSRTYPLQFGVVAI